MIEWLVRIVALVVLLWADGTTLGPTSVRSSLEHRDRSLPESVPTKEKAGPSTPVPHRCVARGQHTDVLLPLSPPSAELTADVDHNTSGRRAQGANRLGTAPRSVGTATPAPREHRSFRETIAAKKVERLRPAAPKTGLRSGRPFCNSL